LEETANFYTENQAILSENLAEDPELYLDKIIHL
jgi:hypothetical protein